MQINNYQTLLTPCQSSIFNGGNFIVTATVTVNGFGDPRLFAFLIALKPLGKGFN